MNEEFDKLLEEAYLCLCKLITRLRSNSNEWKQVDATLTALNALRDRQSERGRQSDDLEKIIHHEPRRWPIVRLWPPSEFVDEMRFVTQAIHTLAAYVKKLVDKEHG